LIKIVVDVLLTIPQLLILVVIASSINEPLTTNAMALVVASLAWMWSARTIRSQVLSLRSRAFVNVARLSGVGSWEIIFKELMPNLLPLLGACLVTTVMGAVFVSLGLEVLGLGPQREPTLGMTMYWMSFYGAFNRGMWWWIATPIVILVLIFIGLFLVSAGLDELANPKLRRKI
jgi:peptide/nickel transport system permease protein